MISGCLLFSRRWILNSSCASLFEACRFATFAPALQMLIVGGLLACSRFSRLRDTLKCGGLHNVTDSR